MSDQIDVNQLSNALQTKVDLDLNNINPSATAKETIVGWGMPDYSAGIGVSIPSNAFSYTCPSDGMVTMKLYGTANANVNVYVNGSVALMANSGSGSVATKISGSFPVSKNDVITISGATSFADLYHYLYFYPLKGV